MLREGRGVNIASGMSRAVLEGGERLAAVAAVREAENRVLNTRTASPQAPPGSLQCIIAAAGRACLPQV